MRHGERSERVHLCVCCHKVSISSLCVLLVVSWWGNVSEDGVRDVHRLVLHQYDVKGVDVRLFSLFHLRHRGTQTVRTQFLSVSIWGIPGLYYTLVWPGRWGSRWWGCSGARTPRQPWSGLLKSLPAAARWADPAALWGRLRVTERLPSCWRCGSVGLWRLAGPPY